ncbi:MAG: ABC transporter permease [Patescibacteria group bacterium]
MKIIDIFRISISTFIHNKMRTLLTIFGVSIGIGAIVFLLSLGYGVQNITINEISSIKALSTLNITSGNSSVLPMNDESVKRFQGISNVTSVSPNLALSGQVLYNKSKTDVLVNSVSSEYVDLESPRLEAGTLYTADDSREIVVTTLIANAFNIKPKDLVGQQIKLQAYELDPQNNNQPKLIEGDYTVIGVIKDSTSSLAYVPRETIEILPNSKYAVIKIKVSDNKQIQATKSTITEMGYTANSLGEKIDQMNQVFNIAKIVLAILGAIALAVASIGMFNTLTISLLERTKDIGIMKSLGATDKEVYAIFLTESTLIGLFGGGVGISIALVIGNLLNVFINILATRAGGEPVKIFDAPILVILVILFFSFLIGFLTGIYPARRAARLNPLDALRYE